MVRVRRRPIRRLSILLATVTTLTLALTSCKCPCGPNLQPGEPLIQGTMRIDPVAKQAVLELQIAMQPGASTGAGTVELWVGPDPNPLQQALVMGYDGATVFEIGTLAEVPGSGAVNSKYETFEFDCLPWTNPLRSRVWNYEGEDVEDLMFVARITRKFENGVGVMGSVVKYFEVPEVDHSWSFTTYLYPEAGQALIGGQIGNDNAPLVGVTNDVFYGQGRFTFRNGEFQAPTHGWRPKRAWVWRIPSQAAPAWDDRSMHVDDAFWSTDSIPPLPAPFPTVSSPVLLANLLCEAGQRYWIYAIVEESNGTTTRYHAHRSGLSIDCTAGPAQPHFMVISPDSETTTVGPAGS